MIFGSFAGDVSLFALLGQFVPSFWLHCLASLLLICVGAIAIALIRVSSVSTPETKRLDVLAGTRTKGHFDE